MSLSKHLAFALHEDWRKTRLKEDGTYEPRWKAIKDKEFVKNLNTNSLPSYVRKNEEGKWEIDIANACYSQLSADWQAENKAAAEIVSTIIESRQNFTRDEIGNIIHNAWLERNSWAKGGNLDVPFEELPKAEQDKDIVQYETGLKLKNAKYDDIFILKLDKAINYLNEAKLNNKNLKINFNNETLYSMFDNTDTCYVKVCGMKKKEFEKEREALEKEFEKEREAF